METNGIKKSISSLNGCLIYGVLTNGINLIESIKLLDEKFHTDRLEIDASGKVVGFISIKPKSFSVNFMQYTDVFAGLQSLQNITGITWKIYFREEENFKIIQSIALPLLWPYLEMFYFSLFFVLRGI